MIHRLILLPGMDGTGELFGKFVDALPGEIASTIVRYPMSRLAASSELLGLVREGTLADESFVLLAESFSTPLAIEFAASRPTGLKGVILCAGFASNPARGWWRWAAYVLAPILFRLPLTKAAAEFLLIGPNAPEALLEGVRDALGSVDPMVLAGRLRATLACDAKAELGRIEVPILYVQGKEDRLVSRSSLREMRRLRPQIFVAGIAGPHLILQREPEKSAEAVVRFLCRLS
jgi:pimeloyl-[acyl-carrier protein] methyl ester esterase